MLRTAAQAWKGLILFSVVTNRRVVLIRWDGLARHFHLAAPCAPLAHAVIHQQWVVNYAEAGKRRWDEIFKRRWDEIFAILSSSAEEEDYLFLDRSMSIFPIPKLNKEPTWTFQRLFYNTIDPVVLSLCGTVFHRLIIPTAFLQCSVNINCQSSTLANEKVITFLCQILPLVLPGTRMSLSSLVAL